MRKFVFAAVGILVLAGTLWLVLGEGGVPSAPPGLPIPEGGQVSSSSKTAPPNPARPEASPNGEAPTKETARPKRKKLAGPDPNAPGPGTGWKVLVVEKGTGKPVPLAEVLFLDMAAVKDRAALMKSIATGGLGKIESVMERFGRIFRADTRGVAWIPSLDERRNHGLPESPILLAARKGRLFGLLPPKDIQGPPLKVEISPRRELLVQVVDQGGNPLAGVPVGVGLAGDDFHNFPLREVTQGPKGIARFRHLDFFSRMEIPSGRKGLVSLQVPMKKAVEKEFDLRKLPRNPLVLTLPPTGRVEVYVQGPEGPISDGEALVTLLAVPEEEDGPPTFSEFQAQMAPLVPVKEGKALFPFVGLELTLQVSAVKIRKRQEGMMSHPETVKGPGPVAPGQTVFFRLSLLRKEVLLTGRLLLPSGKPAARVSLRWTLETKNEGNSSSSSSTLETDEKGRFRFTLEDGKFHGGTRTLTLLLTRGGGGKPLEAKVDLSREFYPGENDLGDVRLAGLPLLLAGKVVDPKGKPIQGARVLVQEKRTFDPEGKHFFWDPIPKLSTRTDKEGRFAVVGESQSSELMVSAVKFPWVQAKWVHVSPGEEGLVLVLRKGGTVKASFLVEPGFPLRKLQMGLYQSGEKPIRRGWFSRKTRENLVSWTGLTPGTYDLKIFPMSPKDPLVEIPGILVEAGKEARDPRLKEIDLRGKIQALDLELFGPRGERVRSATIHLEGKESVSIWFRPGRPLLLRPGKDHTLLIWTSRYKPKRVPVTGKKMKVVLDEGYKIRLIYTGEAPLPEAPFSLGVDLRILSGGKRRNRPFFSGPLSSLYFRKDGTVEGRIPLPGKYRILWLLKKTRGSGWSSSGLSVPKPPVLEVRDVPGVQTFRVSLPAKILEKALERARD